MVSGQHTLSTDPLDLIKLQNNALQFFREEILVGTEFSSGSCASKNGGRKDEEVFTLLHAKTLSSSLQV